MKLFRVTTVYESKSILKCVFQTKLTELGAYVDDELPDYVLVMVANRRGRQDMKKELELFLGDATDRFCSWLFGVLDKLKDAKKTAKDGKRYFFGNFLKILTNFYLEASQSLKRQKTKSWMITMRMR